MTLPARPPDPDADRRERMVEAIARRDRVDLPTARRCLANLPLAELTRLELQVGRPARYSAEYDPFAR